MKELGLKEYLSNHKKLAFGTLLLIILASVFAQLVPYIQGLFVDNAIISQNTQMLLLLCIIFMLVLVLDCFSVFYLSRLATKTGFNIAQDLRNYVFSSTINRNYDFFKDKNNGDLIQRTNYYTHEIGTFLSVNMHNLFIGVSRFFIIFVFMFILSVKIALILSVLYFIVFVISYLYSLKIFRLGRVLKKTELHRNSLVLQNIENMETYLAYNDGDDYFPNYNRVNNRYGNLRNKYYLLYNWFVPFIDILVSVATVFVYYLAFNQNLGVFDIGVVIAMLTYTTRIIEPASLIIAGTASLNATKATWDKVSDLIKEKNTTQKISYDFDKVDIECENVGYHNTVNGENFQGLSLKIPFKSKVLIYGKYGMGKSTVANVLAGLFEATSGKVYLNNINISSINHDSLMKMVSVIGDDVGIFNGSVYQNVRFGNPNATDKQIKLAIKEAGLLRYVKGLNNKEHTRISQHTISESEKQLIAYARLLLKNPKVVIIDEFTRDLEPTQEKAFLKSLAKFCKDKTLIYLSSKQPQDLVFDMKINFKKFHNEGEELFQE